MIGVLIEENPPATLAVKFGGRCLHVTAWGPQLPDQGIRDFADRI